jgi:hypothetical protein
MDGDGSIPNVIDIPSYICSSSLHFLNQIKNMTTSQGIISNIYEIKKKPYTMKNGKTITPKNKHYRLMFNKASTIKLVDWIYYPHHKLSLARKNERAQSILSISSVRR